MVLFTFLSSLPSTPFSKINTDTLSSRNSAKWRTQVEGGALRHTLWAFPNPWGGWVYKEGDIRDMKASVQENYRVYPAYWVLWEPTATWNEQRKSKRKKKEARETGTRIHPKEWPAPPRQARSVRANREDLELLEPKVDEV